MKSIIYLCVNYYKFKLYVINNSISVFYIFESLCELYILRSYNNAHGAGGLEASRAPCHYFIYSSSWRCEPTYLLLLVRVRVFNFDSANTFTKNWLSISRVEWHLWWILCEFFSYYVFILLKLVIYIID